jgi:ABC-2 type transport system ATP-binding protein
MNPFVIQTDRLTRYFAARCAVDQVTLAVPRGSVFALLGRNGSGKTTLVRMLLGMLEPTRGHASILGDDIRHIQPTTRSRIGYIAEGHPLIDWMRVRDLQAFQKSFFPNWDNRTFQTVIDHFGLSPKARARTLSRGQRAGLSLALVLATRPELLVMDDPALGLDPVARRALLEVMILVTRDAGHTIVFTSHELADVERVADHIAIMDLSVLRVCCPMETFRDRIKKFRLTFSSTAPMSLAIPGLLDSARNGSSLQLLLVDAGDKTQSAIALLNPIAVEEMPVSLEESVVAYLRDRKVTSSLLAETLLAGAHS